MVRQSLNIPGSCVETYLLRLYPVIRDTTSPAARVFQYTELMPELPEVETIRRGLAQRVTGDVIESVWLSDKPEPFKSPPAGIATTLEGARIAAVTRMGKHIVFDLEGGNRTTPPLGPRPASRTRRRDAGATTGAAAGATHSKSQWIVHLGMTGSLQVQRPHAELQKHTHAVVRLRSGRELRFVDPRRFGRMWVVHGGFQTHGAEPLDIGFELFAGLFRKRKTPIKSALLNQKLLRGVGNIYADESLFRAGIRPRRRAGTLGRAELRRLYDSVQEVLTEAIAAGGSSISDYFNAEGEPGLFQTQHRVYGRGSEPCIVCGTPIKRIVIAARGTHYCPKCQK
ncbi:MAG: bifunctional DNA-formamidopyrimidine glycosylase/DNA-(apurinic or apyrimidinic site) lyase [Terriglobales bacterium]